MNRRAMTKPFRRAITLAFALTLAACNAQPKEEPPLAGARIGGPFTLTSAQGKPVNWSDFDGKYRIVYFGYTYCPDVCPLDMAAAVRGLADFAKDEPALAAQVQPVFISIDPARDTPQALGEFTQKLSPAIVGLTGSPDAIAQTAKAFGVYYAKGEPTHGGGYLMDHSRIVYLMGRKGEPIAQLPADQGPKAVAAELAKWVT